MLYFSSKWWAELSTLQGESFLKISDKLDRFEKNLFSLLEVHKKIHPNGVYLKW